MSSRQEPSSPLNVPIPVIPNGDVEQGYVQTAPRVYLYYRKIGSGPLLVLLHGGPGGDHQQLVDLDRLADRFTLLYYDQRGGGRSTRGLGPEQVTWQKHVEDLDAVREAFGEERLRVLGYSWGGILLQLFAVEHPDRLRRLVFVGTTLPSPEKLQEINETMTSRLSPETKDWMDRMQRFRLLDTDLEWVNSVFMRRMWIDAFVHPKHADVFDIERLNVSMRSSRYTSESLKEISDSPDFFRRLEKIKAPALAIHGTHDPVPLEGAKELVRMLPDARLLVVEESGHMPWLEAPDEFYRPVQEFLASEAK